MSNWRTPNKAGLLPRWKPTYLVEPSTAGQDHFLGYVGPFDVWLDQRGDGEYPIIALVGPDEAKITEGGHNFDTFFVVEDTLERCDVQDLHIGLEDMCLIYQMCMENEIFARRWPSNKEK